MNLKISKDVEELLKKLAQEDNCSPDQLLVKLVIKEDEARHLDRYQADDQGKKPIRFRCHRPDCFEIKSKPSTNTSEIITNC